MQINQYLFRARNVFIGDTTRCIVGTDDGVMRTLKGRPARGFHLRKQCRLCKSFESILCPRKLPNQINLIKSKLPNHIIIGNVGSLGSRCGVQVDRIFYGLGSDFRVEALT